MTSATPGRSLLEAGTYPAVLEFDANTGRDRLFSGVDSLLDRLLSRILRGERVADVGTGRNVEPKFHLIGLSSADKHLMEQTYGLDRVEARGAWFVAEEMAVPAGLLQFPHHFAQNVRFAITAIADESIKVKTRDCPDAVMSWALLEPAVRQLFRLLERSGFFGTEKGRAEVAASWQTDAGVLEWLGLDPTDLARLGTSVPPATEQVARRQQLVRALAERADHPLAANFRAVRLLTLVQHYYKKADKERRALRRRVLSKDVQGTLCAYFGGDWLAFLSYLGEKVHPDEDVVTKLPAAQVLVANTPGRQAVETRLSVLRRYWQLFDDLHARQAPGMQSLWGLVDDTGHFDATDPGSKGDYDPTLYQGLLPSDLLQEVDRLWGCSVLASAPERIVISISPHQLLAEAFGPALGFWHGCGLTLWFVTQGPMSRTDLTGLNNYYARAATAMAALSAPLAPSFFEEMARADSILGPPETIWEGTHREQSELVDLSISISHGSRRSGFETVRDLLTRFRREWAEQHLESYLQGRSEEDIKQAVHLYQRSGSNRGKPPTLKQFAKTAVVPTNLWFGGDICAFYDSFGEKCPVTSIVVAKPMDRTAFVATAFRGFGGKPGTDLSARSSNWVLRQLSNGAIRYVQLEEAFGRPPTQKEFGSSTLELAARQLNTTSEEVWTWFQEVIRWVQTDMGHRVLPAGG